MEYRSDRAEAVHDYKGSRAVLSVFLFDKSGSGQNDEYYQCAGYHRDISTRGNGETVFCAAFRNCSVLLYGCSVCDYLSSDEAFGDVEPGVEEVWRGRLREPRASAQSR